MKKLKIVEQDIHFLLGRRNGFGTNSTPSGRIKRSKPPPQQKEEYINKCIAIFAPKPQKWFIGKVVDAHWDKNNSSLVKYTVTYYPNGTSYDDKVFGDEEYTEEVIKEIIKNFNNAEYNKYDFPIINEVGGCRLKSKEVEQTGLSKPSTPPVQYTHVEIDLMNAFTEAGHKDTPEEKTKWLLCLRTIFMCDYWKDFTESVGNNSNKTYKEQIEELKEKLKILEEQVPRSGSGGSPMKKQRRSQPFETSKNKIEKIQNDIIKLQVAQTNLDQKIQDRIRQSITLPLDISATKENVIKQKNIITDEFKNAVRFIVNETSGRKLNNDESLQYFYNLLDNDQKVSDTGLKYGETLSSIIKSLINDRTFGNGNTANRVCRMLGEVMGITSFNPSDIISNINGDVLDYGKALERIIKHTKIRKPIQRVDGLENFNIHVIADALGSTSKGSDIQTLLKKHHTTTSITPHTLLDDAPIGTVILYDILNKKNKDNSKTELDKNKANVKIELDNYEIVVKFKEIELIKYTLTKDPRYQYKFEKPNSVSYKLLGNKQDFYTLKIEHFFELDCNNVDPIRNANGHINIAEGWDNIFKGFNNKPGNKKFTNEDDICIKLYKTLMDLGKVLLFEPRTREDNDVSNVFVSIDRNITLIAAIFLKNSTSIYISPKRSEGDTANYLSIFIKSVDKHILFDKNSIDPISPSQSLQEEEISEAMVSQELPPDIGPLLLDALMLPGDIYVAPPKQQYVPPALQQAISSGYVTYSAQTLPSRQSSQAAQNNRVEEMDHDQVTSPQRKTTRKIVSSEPQVNFEMNPLTAHELFERDQQQREQEQKTSGIKRPLSDTYRRFSAQFVQAGSDLLKFCSDPFNKGAVACVNLYRQFRYPVDVNTFINTASKDKQKQFLKDNFWENYNTWLIDNNKSSNSKNFMHEYINLLEEHEDQYSVLKENFWDSYNTWKESRKKIRKFNFGKTSKQINHDIRYLLTLK
jgi:hypothetical protein